MPWSPKGTVATMCYSAFGCGASPWPGAAAICRPETQRRSLRRMSEQLVVLRS